jgi:hypothetical protein
MVLKRSWPAVSQICNLIVFPSSSIVLKKNIFYVISNASLELYVLKGLPDLKIHSNS